jgi:F0F1-type ATP synthase membrane subunit b/b'
MSNPFTIGAGVAFGIKQVRGQRQKQVVARRQQARNAFRAAVDQIQVEISKEIGDAVRQAQRDLRDAFSERMSELQRMGVETAKRCEEHAARERSWREQRTATLTPLVATLDDLANRSRALGATP